MTRIILFNKPCGVISQFSPNPPHQTLKDFIPIPSVYPAGRLDTDSEGLLILTDNGKLQEQISDPKYKKFKTYWVQVEGIPTRAQLEMMSNGVNLGDFITAKANVELIDEPNLWERSPPIRFRKSVPTSWISLSIYEGKNRQVRRMTAKVGLPTLRLVRFSIGGISLDGLESGSFQEIKYSDFIKKFHSAYNI